MLNAIFRPIESWPKQETKSYQRKSSRFRVGYLKMLDDLEAELDAIKATDIIIQLDLSRDQIRNDGWPRAGAKPSSPRVILSFQRGQEAVSMPCDRFTDWTQNLRAIGLTLHALRMVDQYGVTSHGEQYQGFAQIEAPKQQTQSERISLVQFLATWAQVSYSFVMPNLDGVYTAARRRAHPDSGIGSHEAFIHVEKAYQVFKGAAMTIRKGERYPLFAYYFAHVDELRREKASGAVMVYYTIVSATGKWQAGNEREFHEFCRLIEQAQREQEYESLEEFVSSELPESSSQSSHNGIVGSGGSPIGTAE